MSHEFLTSLHSQVIETTKESKVARPSAKVGGGQAAGATMTMATDDTAGEELHRTVGVSMSPKLRARAAARAREVGLSFSRYVQWCLEAELDGRTLSERFRNVNM